MRVLHLHKLTGVSGSEGHLLALLPALRERGVDARFLGLDVPGTDAPRFYERLEELQVPYRRVRCGLDVSPRLARDVVRAVRAESPDLLHTHLVHGDVYGSIAGSLTRTPFLSTRHNDDRYLLGPFRYVDRAFARGARRLIAISDAVRVFLERAGHDPEKLVTVRYGLDELPAAPSAPTPEQAGIPDGAPLAVAVGRLIAQKDHPTLLRAFALVREQLPEARLAILGSGPLESETRALVRELGLGEAVVLPGRTDIRDWLERADVFVHTSRWEGFGIVLLEAMLAGLPIVATRVSAVPEVVVPGETGALVEAGDVAGVARELAGLLANPARARELGEAGRRRARSEFSVARMADRTIEVYGAAVASRATRA
ncbi:MAG: glycosyltransferase family 4 protein [Thermoleophilia bacterium]|nr:glycosyltransferase family 4 protein [Thermoleophilia bacterium]